MRKSYSKLPDSQKNVFDPYKLNLNDYAFKMVDEMRFTDEEVIRINITLGITGDMFKSCGIFYIDFMAQED